MKMKPFVSLAGMAAAFAVSSSAHAAITYVDAVEGIGGNTFATGFAQNDTSWVLPSQTSTDADQWVKRTDLDANGNTIFQAMPNGSAAAIPELTTRISGLANGIYGIWVFYQDQVTNDTQNW